MATPTSQQPLPPPKQGGLPRGILALIAAGFLAIAAMIWLDELLDLPHRLFGAPEAPFSPDEAVFESGLVLALGIAVIVLSIHLSRRLAYLESLIVLCAWCHRVHLGSSWVTIEEFLRVHQAESSHGICPECAARVMADDVSSSVGPG
jgi:hypothetical protein